jgi:hypothetical protein
VLAGDIRDQVKHLVLPTDADCFTQIRGAPFDTASAQERGRRALALALVCAFLAKEQVFEADARVTAERAERILAVLLEVDAESRRGTVPHMATFGR